MTNSNAGHARPLGDDRPSVAVDTTVLTLDDALGLCVLLVHQSQWKREDAPEWRLPGMFLLPGEKLREAALRALREKAGVDGLDPQQLYVFDEPDRDERGRTISVAHLDVVQRDRITLGDHTRLFSVDAVPDVDFDHREIIEMATERVRSAYRQRPDPYRLLPDNHFTVSDLHALHETVLDETLNSDTFRRAMLPSLRGTNEQRRGGRGKPAQLYSLG